MSFTGTSLGIISNLATRTLLSPRDYFLSTMETWLATPKTVNSQWVVLIERFPKAVSGGTLSALSNSITNVAAGFGIGDVEKSKIQQLEGTTGDNDGWDQQLVGSLLGGVVYNDIMGCIFATSVAIPDLDGVSVQDISVDNNGGLKKGIVSSGRNGYASSPLSIDFRETNSSFGDLLIRPWTFLTAHYGRLPGYGHKTNILVMEYANTHQKIPQIPNKIWQFENCCPISVSGGSDLKYSDSGGEIVKNTKWIFSKYYIRHNLYLPIPDLLQKSSFNNVLNSNIF